MLTARIIPSDTLELMASFIKEAKGNVSQAKLAYNKEMKAKMEILNPKMSLTEMTANRELFPTDWDWYNLMRNIRLRDFTFLRLR